MAQGSETRSNNYLAGLIKYLSILGLFITGCTSTPYHDDKAQTPEQYISNMQSYIEAMPKVELHLHLEGTLSPETIATISSRNNLDYFQTAAEVRESLLSRPPGLMGFLNHHFKSQEVMLTRQDFHDAVYTLASNLQSNNVEYAEVFFDPQAHTSRGISFADIIEGIDSGRRQGAKDFAVKIAFIMCINRERSVENTFEMLAQAKPYKHLILGLGLDSGPEYGNPPVKFKEVYQQARLEGYKLTAHADVDVRDSLVHIRQLLDVIKVDRIDHGLNAVDDTALMDRLVEKNMCLTGSPVKRPSNPQLQDIGRIMILDKKGVCISIHTDDPEEFQSGYLNEMMLRFARGSGYSEADMTRLMLNAYKAAWMPEIEKQKSINRLREYAVKDGVDWKMVQSGY